MNGNDMNIDFLELMDSDELEQILVKWNDTDVSYDTYDNLCDLFEQRVSLSPTSIAVKCNDIVLTYEELNDKSNQFANYLHKIGVKADILVGVCANRSVEMLIGVLAVLKAGGAYVPLDPNYPINRLSYLINDAKIKLILTKTEQIHSLSSLISNDVLLVPLDTDVSGESIENLGKTNTSSNIAYVIYTSGSTGQPKGVQITHDAILDRMHSLAKLYDLTEKDVCLSYSSYSFDASLEEFIMPLMAGASVVILDSSLQIIPENLIDVSIKHNVTIINFVPTLLDMYLDTANVCKDKLNVRLFTVGGDPLKTKSVIKFNKIYGENNNVKMYNLYGPTESTIDATSFDCSNFGSHNNMHTVPIGRPVANTRIYILDDAMLPVPIGVVGEVYISGAGISRGYLDKFDLTAEKFIANPFENGRRFYKTGDLGKYLSDGNIEYIGRSDNQAKVRGYRIELGEIEFAIDSSPGVKTSAVITHNVNDISESIIAYVVPLEINNFEKEYVTNSDSNEKITIFSGDQVKSLIKEVRFFLEKDLPDYMIPNYFFVLDKIPLTSNGKIDKKLLFGFDFAKVTLEDEYTPPTNEVEEKLCEIWKNALNLDKVGINDNFFKIGGDSIVAIQVASRAKKEHILLSVKDIFEHQTIRGLHKAIAVNVDQEVFEYHDNGTASSDFIQKDHQKVEALLFENEDLESIYPLSYIQAGMLFQSLYNPESDSYFIQEVMHFGNIDTENFKQSCNAVINRHEILRSYVLWKEFEEGKLCISKKIDIPFIEIDFSSLEEHDKLSKLNELLKNDRRKKIDLSKPPLLRFYIIKFSVDHFVIVWSFHHILLDGWSYSIVLEEIIKTYNSVMNNTDFQYQERKPYKDYIFWQKSKNIDDANKFWTNYLDNVTPTVLSFEEIISNSHDDYEEISLSFSKEESIKLKETAKKFGITISTLLLGGFGILVSRYLNQNEVVIGMTFSGRSVDLSGIENMIGMFLNTLPMRINTCVKETKKYFRELQKNIHSVDEYGYLPLYEIQKISGFESSLFNILFIYENYPVNELLFETSSIKMFDSFGIEKTEYPLTIEAGTTSDIINVKFGYRTLYFNRELIDFAKETVKTMLLSLDDVTNIDNIDLLTDSEKNKLLVDFNASEGCYSSFRSVIELFEKQAEKNYSETAVSFNDESISYEVLNRRVNKVANYLKKNGIKPDSLVAIYMDRSLEMIIGILGVLKAGGAYVPIALETPIERVKHMLKNVDIMLTHNKLKEKTNSLGTSLKCVLLDAVSSILEEESEENLPSTVSPSNLAYVIYTSGSTGNPKGVSITHQNLSSYIQWGLKQYSHSKKTCILHGSIAFDMSITCIFVPLLSGMKIEISSDIFVADKIDDGLSILKLTPSHIKQISGFDFSKINSVDSVVIGGESLTYGDIYKLKEKFNFSKAYNEYGPTETTVGCSFFEIGNCGDSPDLSHNKAIPIGRPITNSALYILDKKMKPVPVGIKGELYIGGYGVARGYLNRPDLTSEKFVANPFGNGDRLYKSGDICAHLPNGNIVYFGRLDNQVKIRGYRVELAEINAEINICNCVSKTITLVRKFEQYAEQLVAYIVPLDINNFEKHNTFESKTKKKISVLSGNNVTSLIENIRDTISKKLPDYMVPGYFVVLDDIPLTLNNKTDNNLLLSLDVNRRTLANEYIAPQSETEKRLCNIWRDILHLEQVGINDDFFKIGGDSILAIQIVSRAKRDGISFSVKDIFRHRTIKELVKVSHENFSEDEFEYFPSVFEEQKEYLENIKNIIRGKYDEGN